MLASPSAAAPAAMKKAAVKKTNADEDGRRRREANLVKVRKEKRDEGLQKRRNMDGPSSSAGAQSSEGGASSVFTAPTEVRLENLDSYCACES